MELNDTAFETGVRTALEFELADYSANTPAPYSLESDRSEVAKIRSRGAVTLVYMKKGYGEAVVAEMQDIAGKRFKGLVAEIEGIWGDENVEEA